MREFNGLLILRFQDFVTLHFLNNLESMSTTIQATTHMTFKLNLLPVIFGFYWLINRIIFTHLRYCCQEIIKKKIKHQQKEKVSLENFQGKLF